MIDKHFKSLHSSLKTCECDVGGNTLSLEQCFALLKQSILEASKKGGEIIVIGNGGSNAIASHFAVDLQKSLKLQATLLNDPSLMSCLSNDYGYDQVYSYPLKLRGKKESLVIAISSSGKSENMLQAVREANEIGMKSVTLTGFSSENPLKKMGTINLWVDSSSYGIVEMAHQCLLHTLIDLWPELNSIAKQEEILVHVHL